jgi:hypothetical protein
MPFQSEKQRRYLWANEPEIARDWTDTYGSRIEAALGGIMRLGYLYGGLTHPDGRRGFFRGAEADARAGRGAMSPGTSTTGGARHGGPNQGDHHPEVKPKGWTPGADTSYTHNPTHTPKTKGFFGNLASGIWDAYTTISPTYNAFQFAKKAFTPRTPTKTELTAAMEDAPFNQQTGPTTDQRDGQQQYIPPYLNDVYAQNVIEEDGLDIDTSTGNMEDWSQRFRVCNQYRLD